MFAPRPRAGTRKLLRDVARDRLRSEIMSGRLRPGDRLDDDELAERLGCSRTPVREALADLDRLGLVEFCANRYTRVAVPRDEDVLPALQALGLLFGGLVRVSVPTLSDQNRAALFRRLGVLLDCMQTPGWRATADAATPVYRTFISECRNPMLSAALRASLDGLTFRLRSDRLHESLPWEHIRNGVVALRIAVDSRDGRLAERATWAVHMLPDPDRSSPQVDDGQRPEQTGRTADRVR
ncbi:GntR family transcriptional regulator [Curtobacterium sp. MCPF17_011]|uniref:GntR family transcriptional regulator n=1 Tax=unclassified Curtobacterium TaxID=257496 RepID=UPI000D8D8C88|nr:MULTISPECIES: GntR family transcriptional regulator [unclassified Curtobacterium]PYY33952.1 GntR family transcriptional regulator [Curtobacterium sp. MCBD17_030]PZF10272.1 GntR family transcriptional regulator [Curtobacterium sp. MCPF17_011]